VPQIVLATSRVKAWHAFAAALSSHPEVQLKQVSSGAEALEAVRAAAPQLVIIDASLPDATPLDLVRQLLAVNALVNSAVVSPLGEEEFHEASEGLGILCPLPENPGRGEAEALLLKLRMVLGGNG
jgi:DNA-binding NarL/FixJ family response regulator